MAVTDDCPMKRFKGGGLKASNGQKLLYLKLLFEGGADEDMVELIMRIISTVHPLFFVPVREST